MKRLITTIAIAIIIYLPSISNFKTTEPGAVENYWIAANDTGHDCLNDWLTHMSVEDAQTNKDLCIAQYGK